MKRILSVLIAILAFMPALSAQEDVKVAFEMRAGFMVDSNPHFFADHLNFRVDSRLNDHFSFVWKQRLAKSLVGSQPLNATDYVYVNYSLGDWDFAAGKQVLECGGFEYDASPIDLHFTTEMYNNIECYTLAVSATRNLGKYRLVGQLGRSPYASMETPELNALKEFSLAWRGTYGTGGWLPMYSANLFEITPGSYSFHFTLGNRVEFTKSFAMELDFINRSKPGEVNLFKDISMIGYASIIPVDWMEIMLKTTYDRNTLWDDPYVAKGFDMWKAGVGMYLYPVKEDKAVRIHWYAYHFGDGRNFFQVGLTLKTILLNWKRG